MRVNENDDVYDEDVGLSRILDPSVVISNVLKGINDYFDGNESKRVIRKKMMFHCFKGNQ